MTAPLTSKPANSDPANSPAQSSGTARAASAAALPAGPFSVVYAFGDSLSDAGNISISTAGTVPQSPYVNGQFSDGPVWVQDLATTLGLPAPKPSLGGGTDFAYGDAQTGQTPVHNASPIDLPTQYTQFVAQQNTPKANALYTVWIGSNDVLNIANTGGTSAAQNGAVATAVSNEVSFIQNLVGHGATNLMVLNLPDLGQTPQEIGKGAATAAAATALSQIYNSDLTAALAPLATGAVKFDIVNTFAALEGAVASPGAYGFANVTQPAWTGSFTDPKSGALAPNSANYLFFDHLHPTAKAHALLATGADQSLIPNKIAVTDAATNQPVAATSTPYTGPVPGLTDEYVNLTTDNLNISVDTYGWFIHSGGGNDAIKALGGINVLDGGTGSNFLTGGTGTDTFFVDERQATADTWSTLNNFHAGDAATLWGVTAKDFNLVYQDNQGAAGFTGLTLHAIEAGKPIASVTLGGFTQADLADNRLSVTSGTDAASGSSFTYIHANS